MTDIQADHDQWQAVKRDWAQGCRDLLDECIKQGFEREESFDLLLAFLAHNTGCSCGS